MHTGTCMDSHTRVCTNTCMPDCPQWRRTDTLIPGLILNTIKMLDCVMHNEEWDNTTVCKHIYLIAQNETHPRGTQVQQRQMLHAHMCSVILVDAHTLPGLCHSAAVAATALRAPAQPQLLLRLTPIKVVCEFSKTRHLSCDCSPAGSVL